MSTSSSGPRPTPSGQSSGARSTGKSTITTLQASNWLIQASPPDMGENRTRWRFGVFEILDEREGPFKPRVLHTVYRGVVEMEANELPQAADVLFAAKLEDVVVRKYKSLTGG
jgi:hypothetical protein